MKTIARAIRAAILTTTLISVAILAANAGVPCESKLQ